MRARGHYVAMYRYRCVLVNYAKCVRAPYIRLHVQELPVRNYSLQTSITERLDRAVNTSASYSGSPGLKSRSRDRLSWCFVVFLSSSRHMDSRPYLKLGHDRILPHHFQFIIHVSPFHSTLYSLSYWKGANRNQDSDRLHSYTSRCSQFVYCSCLLHVLWTKHTQWTHDWGSCHFLRSDVSFSKFLDGFWLNLVLEGLHQKYRVNDKGVLSVTSWKHMGECNTSM
jgi:hypothetical protein